MKNVSLSIGSLPSLSTSALTSVPVSNLASIDYVGQPLVLNYDTFSYYIASIIFASILLFLARLYNNIRRQLINITSAPGPVADLVRSLPSLAGPGATFEPVWWLPSGDLQTIFCSMGSFENVDRIQYERKLIRVPDNGTLALDFAASPNATENSPIAVILHGLTGGSHEHYIRALLTDLTSPAVGFRAVVVNARGCAGAPVTSPRLYHGGTTDDLRCALIYIRARFPSSTLVGVGFSVGANMLAKYLGEEGTTSMLSAGVCLANVWDFAAGIEHMEQGGFMQRFVYNNVLGSAQQALYRSASYALGGVAERWRLAEVFGAPFCGMRWIDDRVASQMAGCKNAKEYYQRNSSSEFLSGVRVPLLGLNACDDPIAAKTIPYEAARASEHFVLATTEGGGHLGWFTQQGGQLKRWYTRPVVEFLCASVAATTSSATTPATIFGDDGMLREVERPDVGCREISNSEIPAHVWSHVNATSLSNKGW
ncbi:alpha/beta hydrolase family protein [Ceratobasidium sp. AG-Ba]|nr:alpha/beta hydrolase family protein [Ceratobasidium sp. AG-Ba]